MSDIPFGGGDVLIAQGRIRGMGGSEMIALEMSEHFARLGSRVVVLARSIDDRIASMFTAVPGVEVRETTWPGLADRLTSSRFSLVWVHHNVVPEPVLRGLVDAPVVFGHLSASVAAEAPLVPGLEAALASAVVFNSPETRDAQVAQGLFARVPDERLHVFPNPAPDEFAAVTDREPAERPRLLVVSNHLPKDLYQALQRVRDTFDVTLVGQQLELGAAPRRVDADFLAQFDVVVSIGKTVQYSLAAGRGVYCYDRFGGPGWLTEENVERAAALNFSGRGFTRRKPGVLAKELVAGWRDGLAFARGYRATAAERYTLTNALRDLEARVTAAGPPAGGLSEDTIASTLLLDRLLRSTTITKDKAVAEHKAALADVVRLTTERDAAVAERDRLRRELDAHTSSKAYRLVQAYRSVGRAGRGRRGAP